MNFEIRFTINSKDLKIFKKLQKDEVIPRVRIEYYAAWCLKSKLAEVMKAEADKACKEAFGEKQTNESVAQKSTENEKLG